MASLLGVDAQVVGVARELTKGFTPVFRSSSAIGDDIIEPKPTVRADHFIRQLISFEEPNEVRPRHAKQLGGLLRGKEPAKRKQRDAIASPQLVNATQ
jgi:hypothetical protein